MLIYLSVVFEKYSYMEFSNQYFLSTDQNFKTHQSTKSLDLPNFNIIVIITLGLVHKIKNY